MIWFVLQIILFIVARSGQAIGRRYKTDVNNYLKQAQSAALTLHGYAIRLRLSGLPIIFEGFQLITEPNTNYQLTQPSS
jgi:hypothetical protein